MGQKELDVLCNVLFGLGMTMELADLKWKGITNGYLLDL